MGERTIVITGVGTTYPLYDPLSKHYRVAIYDHGLAQRRSAEHGGEDVICPLNGAQPALFEKARNTAALATATILTHLASDAFSLDGAASTPEALADPRGWLPGMATAYLADTVAHIRAMDGFADSEEWDVVGVVVHEDVTPRFRALALWGQARGVAVVHIPHNNAYLQTRPDIHDKTCADWILAASPHMRDWYLARGYPKDRIKVTGFVPWDHWVNDVSRPAKIPPDRARAVLHLDADAPVVCFCTGWSQRTNFVDDHGLMEAAAHLILGAAKKEGWQVIWKLHPGDAQGQEQKCGQMAAAYRVPALVTRAHLPYCLRAADVVVSAGPSNVLVDAGICDVPPALFPIRGYAFDGEPPWVIEPNERALVDGVARLLDRREWVAARRKFLKRYAFKVDGKAAQRAARWIRRFVDA